MRGTHGFELAFEVSMKSVLPELYFVLELGGRDREGFWGNVDGLKTTLVREEDQRSGKVVHKKRFTSPNQNCELMSAKKRRHTIITVVGVHAVTVVEPLEGARDVHVEIIVASILLVLNACKVLEQVFVDVERERPGREPLVVDRRMKRECLVHDIDDLSRFVGCVCQSFIVSFRSSPTAERGRICSMKYSRWP